MSWRWRRQGRASLEDLSRAWHGRGCKITMKKSCKIPVKITKSTVGFRDKLHQIFIAILHFNEVTVDVVEVEAARESLVRGSV